MVHGYVTTFASTDRTERRLSCLGSEMGSHDLSQEKQSDSLVSQVRTKKAPE